MSDENMDNDKINELFSEIIKSTNISGIEKETDKAITYDLKQLILLQEVLGDCVSNVSQIIFMLLSNEPPDDPDINEILDVLYKSGEDLNNCMVELFIELDENMNIDEEEDE
jgi:hypothetical protein